MYDTIYWQRHSLRRVTRQKHKQGRGKIQGGKTVKSKRKELTTQRVTQKGRKMEDEQREKEQRNGWYLVVSVSSVGGVLGRPF